MRHHLFIGVGGFAVVLTLVLVIVLYQIPKLFFTPAPIAGEEGVTTSDLVLPASQDSKSPPEKILPDMATPESEPSLTVVSENLTVPWEIAWLPDGTMLVTERGGNLVMLGPTRVNIPIPGVIENAESGLLGMVLHPDFEQNRQIYLYLTAKQGNGLINRVERYTLQNEQLSMREVIIDRIPGAKFHDGGRIAFGPDEMLYITTGDAIEPNSAQDVDSLAGKILRLTPDGNIPSDNPSGQPWYSYGHRNPQGIAWDDQGNLWSTEHGRSGVKSGYDEINRIEPGKNYGWPDNEGDSVLSGTTGPVLHSGPDITWAPASAAYLDGSIFFGGLRGQALYQYKIKETRLITHFHNEFGRVRTVQVGPDGFLYLTTSNQDGRATPKAGDDKVIRLNPSVFGN